MGDDEVTVGIRLPFAPDTSEYHSEDHHGESSGSHDSSEDTSWRRTIELEMAQPVRSTKIKFAETSFQPMKTDPLAVEKLLAKEMNRSKTEVMAMPYENVSANFDDNISEQDWEAGPYLRRRPAWLRWMLVVIIAFAVALQLSGMLMAEIRLSQEKFRFVSWLYFNEHKILALGALIFYAMVAGGLSVILVLFVSAHAASSGIVDTKAFLNGYHIPGFLSFRAWFARSVALVLVTSAGLFAGTEGPLVAHLGAIMSCGIARGRMKICGKRLRMPWRLVGHRTQCEFVLIGTAMGMAAAFGSPVGGVLFSMEFVSSSWRDELTLLVFVGAALAAFFAKVCKNGFTRFPLSSFVEFPDSLADFQSWELVAFMIIGIFTGLLGALFCKGNQVIGRWRARVYTKEEPHRDLRFLEVLAHSAAVVLTCTIVPMFLGCHPLDPSAKQRGDWSAGEMVQGFCASGEYTDMGSLVMQPKHEAIKALFTKHFEGGAYFRYESLVLTYVAIFTFTLLGAGMAMPAGLYVPHIMAGGCLGRVVGQVVAEASRSDDVHPGVYALVGAAGQLAGFSRMPLSLTLIMVEITSNVRLMLPLMVSIMTSKAVADRFIPSVFDVTLSLKSQFKILEGEWRGNDDITVHDLASTEVVVLHCHTRLGHITTLLKDTTYDVFPLVEGQRLHVVGVISRSSLRYLLHQHTGASQSTVLDLAPVADLAPETKHWRTPATRAFRDFVSMGLQHVMVVDQAHGLCGIVTRSDLVRLCHKKGIEFIRDRILASLNDGQRRSKEGEEEHDGVGLIQDELTLENLRKLEAIQQKGVEETEDLARRIDKMEAELADLRPLRERVTSLEQQLLRYALKDAMEKQQQQQNDVAGIEDMRTRTSKGSNETYVASASAQVLASVPALAPSRQATDHVSEKEMSSSASGTADIMESTEEWLPPKPELLGRKQSAGSSSDPDGNKALQMSVPVITDACGRSSLESIASIHEMPSSFSKQKTCSSFASDTDDEHCLRSLPLEPTTPMAAATPKAEAPLQPREDPPALPSSGSEVKQDLGAQADILS